jgi:hypothetical protein
MNAPIKKHKSKKKRRPETPLEPEAVKEVEDEEEAGVFEEEDELSVLEIASDLDGTPRPDENFVLKINGKDYKLVPATLRDIPKLGGLVQSITASAEDEDEMSFFSEEKVNLVAELILLSLSKKDRKKVTIDDILDSCQFADFPLALQACLSLNDFLRRMGQVKRTMESLV